MFLEIDFIFVPNHLSFKGPRIWQWEAMSMFLPFYKNRVLLFLCNNNTNNFWRGKDVRWREMGYAVRFAAGEGGQSPSGQQVPPVPAAFWGIL